MRIYGPNRSQAISSESGRGDLYPGGNSAPSGEESPHLWRDIDFTQHRTQTSIGIGGERTSLGSTPIDKANVHYKYIPLLLMGGFVSMRPMSIRIQRHDQQTDPAFQIDDPSSQDTAMIVSIQNCHQGTNRRPQGTSQQDIGTSFHQSKGTESSFQPCVVSLPSTTGNKETSFPNPVIIHSGPPKRRTRRPNLRPIVKGNNIYGRSGKLRCLQCRLWRQKCDYNDVTLPCTNCSRKSLFCSAEQKVFAREQHPHMIVVEDGQVDSVPRPPKSIANDKIPYFLAFHQAKIKAGHYFRYDNFHQFFTKGVLGMARESPSLEYAVAGFAALVYSVCIDNRAKAFAFIYYAEALRGLQELLNRLVIGSDDVLFAAITVVLQLASIERFVADTGKCFCHIQGAAQILLQFSTPVWQCSTHHGRSLLECDKFLLPKTWRQENIRVREEVARVELHHLSKDVRKARLVDDLLQETWAIMPHIADILTTIPQLKELKGPRLLVIENQIKMDMLYIQNRFKELTDSSRVSEILKITEDGISYSKRHLECCPPLPFAPCTLEFPLAGFLRLTFLSIHNYIQLILYEPLRKMGLRIESLEEESNTVEFYAFEICRTFAAIEDVFGEDLSALLPCFQLLIMAGFSSPPPLRMWLWHKLAHFEKLVRQYIEPFKKKLSVFWDMPELVTMGFVLRTPLQEQNILSVEDIELAAKVVAISLEDSDEEIGDLKTDKIA